MFEGTRSVCNDLEDRHKEQGRDGATLEKSYGTSTSVAESIKSSLFFPWLKLILEALFTAFLVVLVVIFIVLRQTVLFLFPLLLHIR